MIKKLAGETWKQMQFKGYKTLKKRYAVSNLGRAASYVESLDEDGQLLKGSLTSGYRTLNLHVEDGNGTIYLHREVARLYCPKKSPKSAFVIHLNHKKTDNNAKNLKWATQDEAVAHQQKSPSKIAYKKQQANRTVGLKLSLTQVKAIKDTLNNPKRKLTYKQLAEKYGVSEMTLYRIRSGENWGKVK
jgi:hypothetical protein